MINPNAELLKWGPIDGKPIYLDVFLEPFVSFRGDGDAQWPDVIGYFKDGQVVFVVNREEMNLAGRALFVDHLVDKNYAQKKYAEWFNVALKIEEHAVDVNQGLHKISISELLAKFRQLRILTNSIWHGEFVPELCNYAGGPFLEEKVSDFNPTNFVTIFEKITAPEALSFLQREESELLSIKLIDNEDERRRRLKEHQQKYYWLHNSYAGTKVLPVSFFEKELAKISVADAQKRLEEISGYTERIKKEKSELIKQYQIPGEIVLFAEALSHSIWWQDHQKKYTYLINHILSLYLEEISRRYNVPFDQLCYYSLPEIEQLLAADTKVETEERLKGFVVVFEKNGGLTWMEGAKASDFIRPYVDVKIGKKVSQFSGMVVSQGKTKVVQARAKILFTPKEATKLKDGEILVAPMTSPEYVTAMRRASAIVTDAGGITCHAAIISRELGIPCIVNTKIATKVLKNGDMIEVDATRGVVKKL